jgi:hypothetical protein
MNYSLFIMKTKEMVSMEEKGQPGAVPASPPLLSSQFVDLFRVFFVSVEAKIAAIGPTRGKLGPTM